MLTSAAVSKPGRRRDVRSILACGLVAAFCRSLSPCDFSVLTAALRKPALGDRRVHVSRAVSEAWADLEVLASETKPSESKDEPVLTFYRDTNGWCPFCERVWLALNEKGIPYDEVLINLYDKPPWYKDMVPTNLVPAIKFASGGEVIWESDRILRRLDDAFPETKPLFKNPDSVDKVSQLTGAVMNASMGLAYRTGNLTEMSLEVRRERLIAAIDELETHLASSEGPFLLGSELTAADCMAVPMLERYAVQLPFFAAELEIRDADRWPSLARWYAAMDTNPSYKNKVVGDKYSWTIVAPELMRIFSGNNGTLEGATAARAAKAEAAAAELLALRPGSVRDHDQAARFEAASKVLSNRKAIVMDAINQEPKSQKELQRLDPSKATSVEVALQAAVASLLTTSPPVLPASAPPSEVAEACRYVAARLCAPRDMGAPAAAALRDVLQTLASLTDSS
eukprot:TRINITY_DN51844_c0_g1_i1.p1 TRINITY_DN51844_c0_g1~~TRINITY_DN51844_c0_g1_i1.p1  ORF type:complete len:467 (-),score=99.92 TRINITY_DN51844_c0_g1_i1:23-1384(-)